MTEFEWPSPGESWWRQASSDCRASDTQAKYAALRVNSTPSLEAYRRVAGEEGRGHAVRQAAHRLERSVAVQNMVGLYRAEIAGANEGTVSAEEARQILSRIARNGDPSVSVRALETLARLDDKAAEAAAVDKSPEELLAEIAAISPMVAYSLAVHAGADTQTIPMSPELKAGLDREEEERAVAWIRRNPKRAMEWARHSIPAPEAP